MSKRFLVPLLLFIFLTQHVGCVWIHSNKKLVLSVYDVPAIVWGEPGVDGAEEKLLLLWSDG